MAGEVIPPTDDGEYFTLGSELAERLEEHFPGQDATRPIKHLSGSESLQALKELEARMFPSKTEKSTGPSVSTEDAQ